MKIKDIIDQFIAGDWGEETCSNEMPCAVTCVRGADIIPISEYNFSAIPIRYISRQSYSKKCLHVGDIIIEKSGGSPTQSTGRVSFVSQELLDSVGPVVCSNFCTAFRVKKGWNPLYVYYYFQFIYNVTQLPPRICKFFLSSNSLCCCIQFSGDDIRIIKR